MITILENELNFWFVSYSQAVIKEMLRRTLQDEQLVNTVLDCYGNNDFENEFFSVRKVSTENGTKFVITKK